ncbi:MAG: UDP-glucose--hexose-1-phosphate uridylyltransferase [Clostridiales bacterium]|nr:UDP-glucose--hexose-1-phosphate uridylyltransferase [Clostridiales bacterium]
MTDLLIKELVLYAEDKGLIDPLDKIYTVNRLAEALGVTEITDVEAGSYRPLDLILNDIIEEALKDGILTSDTMNSKDLFDTKIMGILTPPPSAVIKTFEEKKKSSSKEATDYYYSFSKATNYIRTDRIAKDEKWLAKTEYGELDITINLSKPEKDPRDIAAAGKAKSTSYPKCLLCPENEGYSGDLTRPARQNHRIIPISLGGEDYFLQYSPYVYYNEHCIILNKAHVPMKIDRATVHKLLLFVEQFPHYTAGSNADIPIVGGSILSHDHFQGGCYTFPMAKAPVEKTFKVKGYEDISAGIVRWPMSVIRISGDDIERLTDLADHIITTWNSYGDEEAFIIARTDDGVRHNAVTPIARVNKDGKYELDLVLRNNITTEEHPLGVYHPHSEYHNIKKENIGLIEVMGLAILPARLKTEIGLLSKAVSEGTDFSDDGVIGKHYRWYLSWAGLYDPSELKDTGKAEEIIRLEIGKTFGKILECAGVFKRTEEGRRSFMKFISALSD